MGSEVVKDAWMTRTGWRCYLSNRWRICGNVSRKQFETLWSSLSGI